jgi:hypothetical protein
VAKLLAKNEQIVNLADQFRKYFGKFEREAQFLVGFDKSRQSGLAWP